MTVEPPWVKASQDGWERRALELRQPLWLKVPCMADVRVGANGHANFERGELAELMGKCRQDIDRAIRTAVEKGWLHEASCTECLIPPGDFIEMSFGTVASLTSAVDTYAPVYPCSTPRSASSRTISSAKKGLPAAGTCEVP